MPRLPDRGPTRKTYEVEDLVVASFIFQYEEWLWRRPCAVTGCDHRMGPNTNEPGWVNWKSCDEGQLPAHAVLDANIDKHVGLVCPCHVAEILNRD